MDTTFSFIERCSPRAGIPSPERILRILTYEVGDLAKAQHRGEVYGRNGYYAEERKACTDIISMIRLYIEVRGWDFAELAALGEANYLERMEHISRHGVAHVVRPVLPKETDEPAIR